MCVDMSRFIDFENTNVGIPNRCDVNVYTDVLEVIYKTQWRTNELKSYKKEVGEYVVSTLYFTFISGCNIIIDVQHYTTNLILKMCQKLCLKNVLMHSR